MNEPRINVEAAARTLCESQLRSWGISESNIRKGVDRYWPCVAAEIEAGIIDGSGARLMPYNFDSTLEAFRHWRRRHTQ